MAAPRLSVLMPVYNGERYLREAVDSILGQTFRDFELIAVDDGSTDQSRQMLEQYASQDARVRVISRPNTGIVGALNDAIQASQSDLLARMDADDVALPHRFQAQLDHLDQHPEILMLGSRVTMIDADGWPIGDMVTVGHGHEEIDDALLGGGWPIVHPSVIMRRKAVEEVGRYHEGTFPNEDHDLFLRLGEKGKLDNLREPLLKYRRHFQSVVFARTRGSRTVLWKVVDEAMRRRGLGGAPSWDSPPGERKKFWSQRREWAWTALKSGHVATARKFAIGAVRERPWCKEAWRVLYCALRGR
jgi:glycosyltransferase involved in cell wall biosynthesis